MITYYGNLFDIVDPGDVIAHGCNAYGIMGAGFAALILNQFPKACKPYLSASELSLGSVVYGFERDITIAHCITQKTIGHYGVHVDYSAVQKSLNTVVKDFPNSNIIIPFIGAGLGGGDKNELISIFELALKPFDTLCIL